MPPAQIPRKAPPSPRRRLGGFIHLLARFYQDYRRAIVKASKKKRGRAVDVDVQLSAEGTMWALHWATVGKNKLHDPSGKIKKHERISSLTDAQIAGLKGPRGQRPHMIQHLVNLAFRLKVRLELELKTFVPEKSIKHVLASESGFHLNHEGLLQFKVRAALPNSAEILRTAKTASGTTIVSWENYHGRGLSRSLWAMVDYSRGRSRWI